MAEPIIHFYLLGHLVGPRLDPRRWVDLLARLLKHWRLRELDHPAIAVVVTDFDCP